MTIDYNKWWKRENQSNSHEYHPSVRFRNYLILNTLNNIKFNNILDVWCWDWKLLKLIWDNFSNIKLSWIDIADIRIWLNKQKNNEIDFFVWDIWWEKLELNNKFDLVICSEVIEHIENWQNVIKNLCKLSDVYIILTTQSWKRYKSDINIWHLKHFELDELGNEFNKYWFKIIQSYKRWRPFYDLQKWLYEKIENKAESIKTWELNLISKLLFNITYYLFLLSIKSKVLWPQIFMLLKKK
ncbi:MAG: methyltransferase [uncultured bacterium (gcode 4)]|uniref:Methyltransferase n=1 Tax=uncultured bacterium (gcode 4) TaxID=1234023 RepID=K2AWY4_9BACT|nr:MAG: methyltransferase [uncultured bacterium (gcode 4)]